jgi:hypothetical protein
MDSNQGLYQRRQATPRMWLALAAAVTAVLVVVILIAVACGSESDQTPADGPGVEVDADATASPGVPPEQVGAASPIGGQPGGSNDGQPGGGSDGGGSDDGGSDGGGSDDGGPPLRGYEVVREQHAVAANGFLRRSLACPDGTVVLGGGVRRVGPIESSPIVLQESNAGTIGGGDRHVWLVALRNTAAANRIIEIRAVCAEAPAGYQLIREDATVESGGLVRHSVSCPPGTVAMGGGAQVVGAGSSNFQTRLLESTPDALSGVATSWTTALLNEGGQQRTIGFRAVCAEPPSGYQVTSVQHLVDGGGFYRQLAACPDGTVPIGGGAGPAEPIALDLYPEIRESFPSEPAAGWVTEVYNWVAPHAVAIRAVCAGTE